MPCASSDPHADDDGDGIENGKDDDWLNADEDGDGVSNGDEMKAGTGIGDPNSYPGCSAKSQTPLWATIAGIALDVGMSLLPGGIVAVAGKNAIGAAVAASGTGNPIEGDNTYGYDRSEGDADRATGGQQI